MNSFARKVKALALVGVITVSGIVTARGADPAPRDAATSGPTDEDTEAVPLSESNIAYFFESRADFRAPLESMARIISSEYRNARDEFTKQEILEKLKPVIDRKVAEAAEAELVSIRVNWSAPEYDFQRSGFSTGLSVSTYLPFHLNGFNFAVGFKGMKPFGFLPVEKQSVAGLQKWLANSRRGYYEVVARVVGAEEQNVDGQSRKTVFVRPAEIRFYTENDVLIGTLTPPART